MRLTFEMPVTHLFRDVGQASGLTTLIALSRPRRYVLRNQAFSPCRGSDPGIRDRGCRRHGLVPTVRVVAAARCRASPDPHRLTRPLTARSQPRLRPRHSRPRDPAVSPPEHPSQECYALAV